MQNISLSTGMLSIKNLQARPVRTACLMLVAAILAFTLFGGSIIALNLGQGLSAITRRFGADLMIVPEGAAGKAQTLLLHGEPDNFYFDAGIFDTITRTDGVVNASAQFYLASLSTDCCDEEVQIIAYDPDTDFVVQPWIAEKYSEKISDGYIVTGSKIDIKSNGTIMLFSMNFPVAAQLSPSASGFDTSVFMTMNTMRSLIAHSQMLDIDFLADNYKDGMVSSVLVKTDPAMDSSLIAHNIQEQVNGIEVIVSQGIFSRLAESLSGFTRYIQIICVVLWVLAVLILAAVFYGIIHERKKEFALFRIIGAERKRLVGIVLCESSIAGLAGGAAGIALACIIIFPFANLISARLELPYLDAPFGVIVLLIIISLVISALSGLLASLYSALQISKAETYFTMREGE